VGIAAAGIAAALGVATLAVKSFAGAVQAQVAQLAGVSAEVAIAQAQTELRRFFATVRRAQRIGPELAAAERLRSQFEAAQINLNTEILGALLQVLQELKPLAVLGTTFTEETAQFVAKNAPAIKDLLITSLKATFPFLHLLIPLAKRIADNTEPDVDQEEDPFVNEFLQMLPPNPWIWPEDQPLPGRPQVEPGV
jgi:hypothetical protein